MISSLATPLRHPNNSLVPGASEQHAIRVADKSFVFRLRHAIPSRTPDAKTKPNSGGKTGTLTFDENSADLNFYVIDGQHRINGAYFALQILKDEKGNEISWDIPAEIFIDLDKKDGPPIHQAQIFIDVNFNQKRVDRSLVADLFPTARGARTPLDGKERAQDLGRKLMLETGPLVGMVQTRCN